MLREPISSGTRSYAADAARSTLNLPLTDAILIGVTHGSYRPRAGASSRITVMRRVCWMNDVVLR